MSSEALEYRSMGPRRTEALGEALGKVLSGGGVVFLNGELGTGKTVLVRGMARGLGLEGDAVTSPTFTLVNEYRGNSVLFHVDLYRIEHAAELEELGMEEILSGEGVAAVEWPERFESDLPEPDVRVTLKHGCEATERLIRVEAAREVLADLPEPDALENTGDR